MQLMIFIQTLQLYDNDVTELMFKICTDHVLVREGD